MSMVNEGSGVLVGAQADAKQLTDGYRHIPAKDL